MVLGGELVCKDRTLLLEEQPEAYKDFEGIIADMYVLPRGIPVRRTGIISRWKRAVCPPDSTNHGISCICTSPLPLSRCSSTTI